MTETERLQGMLDELTTSLDSVFMRCVSKNGFGMVKIKFKDVKSARRLHNILIKIKYDKTKWKIT